MSRNGNDDVSVQHDIFLAFEPHLAMVATGGHRRRDERIGDDLGPDEAPGNIAAESRLRDLRLRVARNGPGAALVFAHGEERNMPRSS
jgi:hypothetical protein